jgi:hypothetical protein
MIEVHVCKDDVANILRGKTQALDLPEGCFLWIHGNMRYYLEHTQDSRRMGIISKAWTCVDQDQALIRLNQGANGTGFQPGRPTGIAGETIENVDRHYEFTLHESKWGYATKSFCYETSLSLFQG